MWWVRSRCIVIQFTPRGKPRVCAASPLRLVAAPGLQTQRSNCATAAALALILAGAVLNRPGLRFARAPAYIGGMDDLACRPRATPSRRGARRREDARPDGPGGRAVSARRGRARRSSSQGRRRRRPSRASRSGAAALSLARLRSRSQTAPGGWGTSWTRAPSRRSSDPATRCGRTSSCAHSAEPLQPNRGAPRSLQGVNGFVLPARTASFASFHPRSDTRTLGSGPPLNSDAPEHHDLPDQHAPRSSGTIGAI